MENIITTRMVAYPCPRYSWYAARGFSPMSVIQEWKYETNRIIESRGIELFHQLLWNSEPVKRYQISPLTLSRVNYVWGLSEAAKIEGLGKNRKYVLYCRSMSPKSYDRIGKKKIHKVNNNVTLEALLNYYILSQNDEVYEPIILFINRGTLAYHIEPLFSRLNNFEHIATQYFEQVQEVLDSSQNVFSPPEAQHHCYTCLFKRKCQRNLLDS